MNHHCRIALIICLLCISSTIAAQKRPSVDWRKKRFSAVSALGVTLPVGGLSEIQEFGFSQIVGIDYFATRSVFTRTLFDFANTTTSNQVLTLQGASGPNQEIRYGGFNMINISQGIGYRHTKDVLAPYIFGGIGASFLTAPSVKIDYGANTSESLSNRQTFLLSQFNMGFRYVGQPYYLVRNITRKRSSKIYPDESDPKSTYVLFLEGGYVRLWDTQPVLCKTVEYVTVTVGIRLFL